MRSPSVLARSVVDGVSNFFSKVGAKLAVFAALVGPVFLFVKDFATATIALVGQTFGAGNAGVSDIIFNAFGRIPFFESLVTGTLNNCLRAIDTFPHINVGIFMRLLDFDSILGILSWYLSSLLVVWFLSFLWSCFMFIVKAVLNAVT